MTQDEVFVSFLRAHHGSLYRTAYLLTGTHDGAEELLQDTVQLSRALDPGGPA